jgi:FMN phosphatase YigB (HAD superfamily)
MPFNFAERSIENVLLDFDQTMYPNTLKLRQKQRRLIGKNLAIHLLNQSGSNTPSDKDVAHLQREYHRLAKSIGHSKAFNELGGSPDQYLNIIKQTEQSPLLKPDPRLINMLEIMQSHAGLFIFTGSFFGPVTRALNILLDGQAESLINQVVASDTLPHGKPDPEAYLEALEFLQLDPLHSVMVDDRLVEITAAKSVGMSGILVGRHSLEEKSRADATIPTIHSLLKILSR